MIDHISSFGQNGSFYNGLGKRKKNVMSITEGQKKEPKNEEKKKYEDRQF